MTWTPAEHHPDAHQHAHLQGYASVWQTNTWTYSYAVVLQAANSLPVGSLTVRALTRGWSRATARHTSYADMVAAAA